MTGEMLQVDPAELRVGSAKFRTTHLDLRETATKIHKSHSVVQETWTGGASESVATAWEDLHKRLVTHFDKIAEHAEKLTVAANGYTNQDNANEKSLQPTSVLRL